MEGQNNCCCVRVSSVTFGCYRFTWLGGYLQGIGSLVRDRESHAWYGELFTYINPDQIGGR